MLGIVERIASFQVRLWARILHLRIGATRLTLGQTRCEYEPLAIGRDNSYDIVPETEGSNAGGESV